VTNTPDGANRLEMGAIELHGSIGLLSELEDYVLGELEHLRLSADLIQDIRLVAEEIFSNIVFHAYPGTEGTVRVRAFVADGGKFCIRFEDRGSPFNPLEHGPPNLDADLAEREIGGLGIYLVRKLAHHIHYARDEGGSNVLTVCFRF
jgi:serine/threonine-protein kinase RsbW